MDNLTEAEVIKTKDFYQKMTKNIEAICFKHLDHDVFKTFEINVKTGGLKCLLRVKIYFWK